MKRRMRVEQRPLHEAHVVLLQRDELRFIHHAIERSAECSAGSHSRLAA